MRVYRVEVKDCVDGSVIEHSPLLARRELAEEIEEDFATMYSNELERDEVWIAIQQEAIVE